VRLNGVGGYEESVELPEVILVPGNPLDVRPEHLRPLTAKIESDHGLRVDVAVVPQRGYGVTWWEVLLIYVGTKGADAAAGHAFQLLLDSVTEKAKDWYRDRRKAMDDRRPFHLAILDDDGNVLRALELRADGAVDDVTEQERLKPLQPPPEPTDDGGWRPPQ